MLTMHKIHHKIILGIAAVAVIAGIVYVANQSKGASSTLCEAKAYTLSETNLDFTTYVPVSGTTEKAVLSYDATKMALTSSDYTGIFTLTTTSGTKVDRIGALDLTVFTSGTKMAVLPQFEYKNKDLTVQEFTNVKYDPTLSKDLAFSTSTLSTKEVVIDPTLRPTYIMADGSDLSFDGTILYSKTAQISVDGGTTYLKLGEPVTLAMLEKLIVTDTQLYVQKDGKVNAGISVIRADTKSLALGIDVGCDVPVDPCAPTKVCMDRDQKYTTSVGMLYSDGRTLSSVDGTVKLSFNGLNYVDKISLEEMLKAGFKSIYLLNKAGEKLELINTVYDLLTGKLCFEIAPSTGEKSVVLSNVNPVYKMKDGSGLSFDSSTFSLYAKDGALISFDNLKFTDSLSKEQLLSSKVLYVKSIDGTITIVGMSGDPEKGTLTLTIAGTNTCVKDEDKDGIADEDDACKGTQPTDAVVKLTPNSYMLQDFVWVGQYGTSKLPNIKPAPFTLTETRGCSCTQMAMLQLWGRKAADADKEAAGLLGDEDRAQNEKDYQALQGVLTNGCSGGKNGNVGIVGDWIEQRGWADPSQVLESWVTPQ